MAARLIRTCFEDLCQSKPGAIAPPILCGIMLGAVIAVCMHKPPAAGSQNVQSSSGQVHAACQPGAPAASAARSPEPSGELIAHGSGACPETIILSDNAKCIQHSRARLGWIALSA